VTLRLTEAQLPALAQQRNEALAAVMDRTLSPTLKAAMAERAALDTLAAKARSVVAVLTDPNLDPARWREPAVFAALRRALAILVEKAVVSEGSTRSSFLVTLSVTKDSIGMRNSGPVVKMGSTRARTL
jgi:hypothetical protein